MSSNELDAQSKRRVSRVLDSASVIGLASKGEGDQMRWEGARRFIAFSAEVDKQSSDKVSGTNTHTRSDGLDWGRSIFLVQISPLRTRSSIRGDVARRDIAGRLRPITGSSRVILSKNDKLSKVK